MQLQVQVSGCFAWNAPALQAQLAPGFPARRHRHFHGGAAGRGDFDRGAKRRLPWRHHQRLIDIAALGAPAWVGFEKHLQKQIACRRTAPARAALARQADELALAHALGYFDLQAALVACERAVVGLVRTLQRERALGAQVGIGQIELNAGMVVVAACGVGLLVWLSCAAAAVGWAGVPTPSPKGAARAACVCTPAKQLVKKVAVVIGGAALCATAAGTIGELEPRIPVRWWPKVVPRLGVRLLCQAVVGRAFFGV